MKVKVGIEGFTIDSAHYTLSSPQDSQLHGHTYILNVEIEGEVNPSNGFVIDFNIAKKTIQDIISKWDHKFIVPTDDYNKINIEAPFKVEVKNIDAPFPTAEYIAIEVARDIYEKLDRKFKIAVKIYEGKDSYAIVEYP
ncbi:6-pyruvoyl trahydropterin synthase family protein [Acidianus brierleyi]|uniref:6-pyruvoyl tetrahydrobiopterin synthase n=1 Tax=Acidianus brierleyi TaxID=41673 RepID=A0A2U9IBI0_9CREN|nr:6-pyruvoyl tetrahydropterin synthase family protein [Acidianus brierleyi]AWR93354.1 6-pyruvoyl tetrahydrobiopterin synthase [Acidianus brierleyi]